jgi:hypothetical protein
MRYAAERGLKLNTGYIARYTPDCNDVGREITGSETVSSAYIFARSDYPNQEHVEALFSKSTQIRCSEVQFAYVCQSASEDDL